MHGSHLLAAAALCCGLGLFVAATSNGSSATATPAPPAEGHFVFVVEGHRDAVSITHVQHKTDPWAGVQKGLRSDWTLSIRDLHDRELRRLPLDMSQFDLQPGRQGQALRVEGCVVRDPNIAMLVNVPTLPGAARYVFRRGDAVVGAADAAVVNQMAGGGR